MPGMSKYCLPIFIVAVLSLESCQVAGKPEDRDQILIAELKKDLDLQRYQGKEAVIFLVTGYDCKLCIQSLKKWTNDLAGNSEINLIGLFYGGKRVSDRSKAIEHWDLPPIITWKVTNNLKLFDYLATAYQEITSPYAIIIDENEIFEVKSVNRDSFE